MVSAVYIESLQFSMIPLSIFAGVRVGVLFFDLLNIYLYCIKSQMDV